MATLATLKEDASYTASLKPKYARQVVEISVVAQNGNRMRLELDASQSLADQVAKIHQAIGDRSHPAHEWALFAPWMDTFVTAELWLEGIPSWLNSEHLSLIHI